MEIFKHPDFKKYFDRTQKRNIWVLGYFGGGAVNITAAYKVALLYSHLYSVPVSTVCIDEILSSRRFKGFKFIYSSVDQRPDEVADQMDNVYSWLID